jgi:pectate lyase
MDAAAVITTTAATGDNIFVLGTVTGEYMGQADYNQSELCAGYDGFRNITVRGGTLVGNDKNKSCLIRMAHATNVTFDGVTFSGGAGSHQMEVAAIDGLVIKNCTFQDFYGLKGVTGTRRSSWISRSHRAHTWAPTRTGLR